MLEKGTSGLMSGEGKRAAASRPRTALFLDSTRLVRVARRNRVASPSFRAAMTPLEGFAPVNQTFIGLVRPFVPAPGVSGKGGQPGQSRRLRQRMQYRNSSRLAPPQTDC